MVLNPFEDHRPRPESTDVLVLSKPAHILDRAAAVVIDFVILSIFTGILLSPFKKEIQEAQLLGNTTDVIFGYIFLILGLFVAGIAYQMFFLSFLCATPGKKIMGLRVVNIWSGEKIQLDTAFFRSLIWWSSWLLMGFPHLGVLNNEKRRPWHDRFSDTIVVSIRGRYSSFAVQSYSRALRSGLIVVFFVVGSYMSYEIIRTLQGASTGNWMDSLMSLSPEACEDVDLTLEAGGSWERLDLAVSLFAAGVIDEKCLDTEARRSFLIGEDVALAYLARAFSQSDDPDMSDSYLKKVCEVEESGSACDVSEVITHWTNEDWERANEVMMRVNESSPMYFKVWAVKHFERVKNFNQELQVLSFINGPKEFMPFINSHRAVALWGMHKKDESRVAIASALESLSGEARLPIASWFCYRDRVNSCEKSMACSSFEELYSDEDVDTTDMQSLLVYVRGQECVGETKFTSMAEKTLDKDFINYLGALNLIYSSKLDEAKNILLKLASSDNTDKYLAHDARLRLLEISSDKNTLDLVLTQWFKMDNSTWEWSGLGNSILEKMISLNKTRDVLVISQRLYEKENFNERANKALVVSAFELGLFDVAQKEIKNRAPASADYLDDKYKSIVSKLKSGGNP